MAKAKKYIFVNGVMQINPEYQKETGAAPAPSAAPTGDKPLAIVSSMADVAEASTSQMESTGNSLQLSQSTVSSMEIMQDEEFTNQFGVAGGMDGSDLLEGLTNYFIQYEIPVGLINKLMALQFYNLNFIIDDSGSMRAPTDSMMSEALPYVLRGQSPNPQQPMTRWQEAENRLHSMMDVLAYIPTKSIVLGFLNAPNVITLNRAGLGPDEFKRIAHDQIAHAFATVEVRYKTPTHRVLSAAFQAASSRPDPTMHYLLTDGVPSDASVEQVAQLITTRPRPDFNPLTLISCTNEDAEAQWMKEVEEKAPFTSEVDDFGDEKREVMHDQGVAFPYTKGYWIVCQLVSAINPADLDAIDENMPFTKSTLDNVLGRVHTPQEYQYYFERNPHAPLYVDLYPRFLNEPAFARDIVHIPDQQAREMRHGYRDGARPNLGPVRPEAISSQLAPHTAAASGVAYPQQGGTGVFNMPPPAYSDAPPPYTG